MEIKIVAIGAAKKGPHQELTDLYLKRLKRWKVSLTSYDIKNVQNPQERRRLEAQKFLPYFQKRSFVVMLDETGAHYTSKKFAHFLEHSEMEGVPSVTFLIGGADGFDAALKQKANLCLGFGHQTWPHLLVRVMLAEQIYRAQQLLLNHPYHK